MLRRIQMSGQGGRLVCGLLLVALGLTASCSSGAGQHSAAATARPAASSVSAPLAPGTSPAQPPVTHVAPTGGDPAIYAAAISEIQSYLTMEVQHGPYAAAAAYLAADEQAPVGAHTTWPVPDADPQVPVLIAGTVYSYEPWSWTSADLFTLSVTSAGTQGARTGLRGTTAGSSPSVGPRPKPVGVCTSRPALNQRA